MPDAREQIAAAAFRLFMTDGYDSTSVDDIAREAGVSRSTLFRLYGSKEAIIFPDHEQVLSLVEERLGSGGGSGLRAVTDAVKVVLAYYMAEGDRARERYRLTSAVPALRERELISGARYQALFRRYLSSWGDGSEDAANRAEMMAAAVVAAHNRVLRRWLRGETRDPQPEVERALAVVRQVFSPSDGEPLAVVVIPDGRSMIEIEAAVRRFAGQD